MPALASAAVVAAVVGGSSPTSAADTVATYQGGHGNWSDPAKWSTNPAFPNNAGGTTYHAVVNPITNVTVALTQPITINRLDLSLATIAGDFDLTINDSLDWTSGTIAGTGTLTLNGVSSLSGAASKGLQSRSLYNGGTFSLTGGSLFLSQAIMHNLPGGMFDLQGDHSFNQSNANIIHNAGTFRKSAGTGSTIVGAKFNNAGLIEAQSGTLDLRWGGDSSGTFEVTSGATLAFAGTHDLSSTSHVSGAGIVSFGVNDGNYPATVNLAGTYDVSGTTRVQRGRINFNGGSVITSLGTIEPIIGGSLNFNTGQDRTIAQSLMLQLGGVGGTDKKTLTGKVTWQGGGGSTGAGRLIAQGGLEVDGGAFGLDGQSLENESAATIKNVSSWTTINGGKFINRAGGVVEIFNSRIGGDFENAGEVKIRSGLLYMGSGSNGGNGTSTGSFVGDASTQLWIDGARHSFASTASVNVPKLSVYSNGTATFHGPVTIGGALHVSAGTVNFEAGSTPSFGSIDPTTAGTINFSTGTAQTLKTTEWRGTLGGSDTVHLADGTYWMFGSMLGTGKSVVNNDLAISNSNGTKTLNRTLENHGVITWWNGTIAAGATGRIDNRSGATFQINEGVTLSGTGTFENHGSFVNQTGGASFVTNVGGTFENTGIVQTKSGILNFTGIYEQNAGMIHLDGGSIRSTNPLTIAGGLVTGEGAIDGSVNSGGVFAPGNGLGEISVFGALMLGDTSEALFEIGGTVPGTSHDSLLVGAGSSLDGDLLLRFANGFEDTVLGTDVFTIISANPFQTLTGQFDNVADGQRLVTTDGLGSFRVRYLSRSVRLDQFQAIPEPSSLAAALAFSAILLARRPGSR